MVTDEGMLKCKHCNYKGHLPLLRIHLYLQHGLDYKEDEYK